MLSELELSTQPEFYFESVPWQVLANINEEFRLTESKRQFLKYVGGLLYTEISTPIGFEPIYRASQRLGVNIRQNYWALHIKEDARHGEWMLEKIALPLLQKYPLNAHELLAGYSEKKAAAKRAATAVVQSVRRAQETKVFN
jgi:hypothetical protein